jgi:hypothetical protein
MLHRQRALADLYRFYRAGTGMLACRYRDFAALPADQARPHQPARGHRQSGAAGFQIQHAAAGGDGLPGTSIGIKHVVTTREAFLERLATAIELIMG